MSNLNDPLETTADGIRARMPGAPLEGESTAVRPATRADVDLLARWHADPEVARYWGGQSYSREEVLARLARPHVDAYIVEVGGEPVGYLQARVGGPAAGTGRDLLRVPAAR